MKNLTIFALLALFATGCNSQKHKDIAAIRNAVAKISQVPMPRKPGHPVTHTIHTSKGALTISTCGGRKDKNGEIFTEGPARPTGYFLIPRLQWVDDAAEAERLLVEDYKSGNCEHFPVTEL